MGPAIRYVKIKLYGVQRNEKALSASPQSLIGNASGQFNVCAADETSGAPRWTQRWRNFHRSERVHMGLHAVRYPDNVATTRV